ncbi:efflux RND transporter periplasmic adaptor subunit [Enterococcus saccharolyticus]|uniref:efflux RND transporter periplasmic adaptor subunit n=1 Tax=Enterococcus TaxID=1350 RepID=UPI001E52AA25|nr:efflux RND transporter periplasmic adaptor subunit [Enterococcus saccharolyticus]MCD5003658.1 efflux RND transporter periplasmic adaptor subunit [Enterococcus saccharolyticus]
MRKRKKITKKQQVIFSILAGIIGLAGIVGAFFYSQNKAGEQQEGKYQVVTIEQTSPLILKGTVIAERTQSFYYDPSKGEIAELFVLNGQEIKVNTPLFSYENLAIQDQLVEQQQTLEKLNLAVHNAQQNLDNAYIKKQELQNQLDEATISYDNADNSTTEGQQLRLEEQAKKEQYQEAISTQEEVILQAQQTLDAAYVDLSGANATIENTQNKEVTNIFNQDAGIVIVNEEGKNNSSIPYIQVVSKETVIEGKVTEYDYERLNKDMEVAINFLHDNSKIAGTITQINPLPDTAEISTDVTQPSVAMYSFKIKPKEEAHYGYNCQISLNLNELRIPKKAIISESKQEFVYVVNNGEAKRTPVTIERKDDVCIVLKGLKEKDQIIANPDSSLKDGQEVAVN